MPVMPAPVSFHEPAGAVRPNCFDNRDMRQGDLIAFFGGLASAMRDMNPDLSTRRFLVAFARRTWSDKSTTSRLDTSAAPQQEIDMHRRIIATLTLAACLT